MEKSALQMIVKQLRQKKAQAETRLENLQMEAQFSTAGFYDYLLLKVDSLANADSKIANPSAYFQEHLAKAKNFYQIKNQNPLADTVNEDFNLQCLFLEGDSQTTATQSRPSVRDQLDHHEKPNVSSVSINKEIEPNNLAVAAFHPSGHQVDNGNVNKVSHREENNELPKRPRTADQQSCSQEEATNLSVSFSMMPPEILHIILNKSGLQLREKMSLRAVSPPFRDVIEEELQQKTSLSLIVDNSYQKHLIEPKPDDLIIKIAHFNGKKYTPFLGRLFPRVTKLAMYSNSLTAWRNAPELIRLYATQLETLTVDGHPLRSNNEDAIFKAFGESINSLATFLTSLDLRVNGKTSRPGCLNVGRFLPYLGTTLSRLNRFTCTAGYYFIEDNASLISTSLSHRCTHLRLTIRNFRIFKTPSFTQLASNLTHLHLIDCWNTVLPSLSQLGRLVMNFFDSSLLQKLCPLSQLTELHLLSDLNFSQPLARPPSEEFTFPNVKRLTLQLSIYVHGNFHFDAKHLLQTLCIWFPKLAQLSLFIDKDVVKEMESIQLTVPYTVTLLKEKLPFNFRFW